MSALPHRMLSSPSSANGRSRASRTSRGAWLMATARHRAIDHFGRSVRLERKHEDLGRELEKKIPISSGGLGR